MFIEVMVWEEDKLPPTKAELETSDQRWVFNVFNLNQIVDCQEVEVYDLPLYKLTLSNGKTRYAHPNSKIRDILLGIIPTRAEVPGKKQPKDLMKMLMEEHFLVGSMQLAFMTTGQVDVGPLIRKYQEIESYNAQEEPPMSMEITETTTKKKPRKKKL